MSRILNISSMFQVHPTTFRWWIVDNLEDNDKTTKDRLNYHKKKNTIQLIISAIKF